jgi:hypothetical protein
MIRRFNRYELKYLIHASQYRPLAEDLLRFMTPDPHGDIDGFYRIVSLYYDSPALDCWRNKIEGFKFRRKLRLRIYPGTDIRQTTHGFVEIKQRIAHTVQKRRIWLPLAQAYDLCEARHEPPPDADELDRAVCDEVKYLVHAMHLRPTCVVSYRRRALIGLHYEPGMRVTFDMQVGGRMHALAAEEAARNHLIIPPDWYVMEVKVNDRVPLWMTSLAARYECRYQRFSKYVSTVSFCRRRFEFALGHKENRYGQGAEGA